MRNAIGVLSLFLATSVATLSLSALSVDALSETNPHNSLQTKQDHKSPADRLISIFRRKPKGGGTRGEFCSIWPNRDDPDLLEIWSDRPLFVWQGRVRRIEVRLPESEAALWGDDVVNNKQKLRYNGLQLQPGEEYDYWVLYETTDEGGEVITNTTDIPFIIMGEEERDRITDELMALEEQLQASGASTEAIALEKVDYFAQENLWSDAIGEAFSLASVSEDGDEAIAQIREMFCPVDADDT